MVSHRVVQLGAFAALWPGAVALSAALWATSLLAAPQCLAEDKANARVVSLQGTQNTRDIGGYPASGERSILWNKVYRSGELSRLTRADFQKLETLGIRTVIDLRNSQEVERAPTQWQGQRPPRIVQLPIGKPDGWWVKNQSRLLRSGRFDYEDSHKHLLSAYSGLHEVGADSYRQLFDIISDQANWPILIHCSAGKDRTGVAVALIMAAVDVGRDDITADFLLTNEVAHTRERAAALAKQIAEKTATTGWRTAPKPPAADAYFPFLGVTPEMMDAFYASLAEHYGSMDAYLDYLGVDSVRRDKLKDMLTQ